MATLKSLQKTLNALVENQVTKEFFTGEITKLNERLDEQDKAMKDVKKRLKIVEASSKTMPNDIYGEMHEQELRKKNAIIFGFPEQTNGSRKERFERERNGVMKLLADMEISNNELKMRMHRLGKISANGGSNNKPRPLKIILENQQMRDKVFSHTKNLKGKTEWKRVSIVPDLTKTQQALAKSRRKELLELAAKNNSELTQVEIDNETEYKVIGHYGHGNLRMIKTFQYYAETSDEEEGQEEG